MSAFLRHARNLFQVNFPSKSMYFFDGFSVSSPYRSRLVEPEKLKR